VIRTRGWVRASPIASPTRSREAGSCDFREWVVSFPEEVPETVVSVLLEFIGAAALHG
jgi:hypothetical protein